MRSRILTDAERNAIKAFLKAGETRPILRNIRSRAKRNLYDLGEDLELLRKFVAVKPGAKDRPLATTARNQNG